MSWWIAVLIVASPFVVYAAAKLGAIGFFRGREWYHNNRRGERDHGEE
jgi:hypothetical protein